MEVIIEYIPLVMALFGIAATGGFLAGLLGIGGGLIFVPGLYYTMTLLGYNPDTMMHVAVGTSMAMIVANGLTSTRGHWKKGAVNTDIAKKLGLGIFVGVVIGTLIADYISGESLKVIFAVVLALLSILMFIDPAKYSLRENLPKQPFLSMCGTISGAVSTLMGVGGGVMNVPLMTLCRIPVHTAVGTSAALGLIISIPATAGFIIIGLGVDGRPPFSLGYINLLAWSIIVPVSIIAVPFGVRVAHNVSRNSLRHLFAIFMVFIAARMIYEVLYG